jgi:hypothetical protein
MVGRVCVPSHERQQFFWYSVSRSPWKELSMLQSQVRLAILGTYMHLALLNLTRQKRGYYTMKRQFSQRVCKTLLPLKPSQPQPRSLLEGYLAA